MPQTQQIQLIETPEIQPIVLIDAVPVVRGENGDWSHPGLPSFEDEDIAPVYQWLAEQQLIVTQVELEGDAPPEISERYFEAGEPDFSYWEPSKPTGDGWFMLSIHDTEDGPCCWWAQRFSLLTHLERQRTWSEKTFGPGPRTAGVCDHIRKELKEIEAAPHDISEWIDVAILALDGAWRAGATPQQIVSALVAKQLKNESRTWPDWRTSDPTKAIEHDRSKDAPAVMP